MRALLSSSALAVNFFDPWRSIDKASLGAALQVGAPVADLRFEYVCRNYPVGPRSPNLDLLATLANGRRVAIESKFAEPYRSPGRDAKLAAKYFKTQDGYWTHVGLSKAQSVAETLRARWEYLDAAQLLKHMLGLANDGCASVLLYLWFDTGLEDAVQHRREIGMFAEAVRGDHLEFRALTYQEAFDALEPPSSPAGGWHDYMATRYFNVPEAV